MKKTYLTPTVISFCCGIGGFDMGAKIAGFRTIYRNDIWNAANAAFLKNHKGNSKFPDDDFRTTEGIFHECSIEDLTYEKIRDYMVLKTATGTAFERGDIDLFLSGSPCQDQAAVNSRKRNNFTKRNRLMLTQLRLIRDLQVKVAILEQVPSFYDVFMEDLRVEFLVALEKLTDLYHFEIKVLNAMEFGAAQNRNRVVIMLVRKDLGMMPSFPEPQPFDESLYLDRLFPEYQFWSEAGKNKKIHPLKNSVCNTLTASGSYFWFMDGKKIKMTIEDKLKISGMQGFDLDIYKPDGKKYSEKDKGTLIGNMVQIMFSKNLCEQVRINILRM